MRIDKLKRGVIFSLLAALFYTMMCITVKIGGKDIPNAMMIFFRQLFSLMIISSLIPMRTGSFQQLRTEKFPLHMLRTFGGVMGMYCLYFAVEHLPLVDAMVLAQTRPLFIPLIALLWMKKKWEKNLFWGLIAGFIGIMLMLKPGFSKLSIPMLVGLGAGIFPALAFLAVRRLTKTEAPDTIFFYYLLFSLPIAVFPMMTSWETPSTKAWIVLILIPLIATAYQMCLMRAFQSAKAHIVTTLLYSSVIFSALFDVFYSHTVIDPVAITGILLIAAGSFFVINPHYLGPKRN